MNNLSVITCQHCNAPLLAFTFAGTGGIFLEYTCIPDGVSCIHPAKLRNNDENGPVIAEWEQGIGISAPIVFDESVWGQFSGESI